MSTQDEEILSRLARIEEMLAQLVGGATEVSTANEIAIARARGVDLADYLRSKATRETKRRKVGVHA